MSDVINTIALISLSVFSLAAIGWFAIPKAERGTIREVPARDWVAIVKTGARVLSTWGPRLDFYDRSSRSSTVPFVPQAEPCTDGPRH